jgi:hypothetical protein
VAVEVLDDFVELLDYLGIVCWLAAHLRKCFRCVGDAVLLDEPAGALVHEEHPDEETATRQNLESERDAPFSFVGGIRDVEINTVVDEERKAYPRYVEELLWWSALFKICCHSKLTMHPIHLPRISLGAFSPIYVGITALINPTPKPPITLPTYNCGKFPPKINVCTSDPTINTTSAKIIALLRPNVSLT